MFKYTKRSVKNYTHELSNVDFALFNKFILNNILANLLKFNTIVPIMAAIAVVVFSLSLQNSFYIFIPQSNITSFATYMLFAFVASLLLLTLYPLIIIITLNYIAYKLKGVFRSGFFPFKILLLSIGFYLCVVVLTASTPFTFVQKLYVAILWLLLYFTLINVYIAFEHHLSVLKLTRVRVFFIIIFVALLVRPFLIIFLYTSEKINYTAINPKINLSATDCKLITTPISDVDDPKNLAMNNQEFYQTTANGCHLSGNLIRYGFGGDYVLIFKKNIVPIIGQDQQKYNAYVRLNCYSSSCYTDDNIYILNNKDEINDLIQLDLHKTRINRDNMQQHI